MYMYTYIYIYIQMYAYIYIYIYVYIRVYLSRFLLGVYIGIYRVSQNEGYLIGGPHSKYYYQILRHILGSHYSGKPPCFELVWE